MKYEKDGIEGEGKTKIVWRCKGSPDLALIEQKVDITAGDGKKHDQFEDKDKLATETTSNVFIFLMATTAIPVAFDRPINDITFLAEKLKMLQVEVVVRGSADGSYCKRVPEAIRYEEFPEPFVEFYLKTKDKDYKGNALLCDDPLMFMHSDEFSVELFLPGEAIDGQKSFLELNAEDDADLMLIFKHAEDMERYALEAFNALKKEWKAHAVDMIDCKFEFGVNEHGQLRLGDVVDNDSWRLRRNNEYICKQSYRDGGDLEKVKKNYTDVAQMTGTFLEM